MGSHSWRTHDDEFDGERKIGSPSLTDSTMLSRSQARISPSVAKFPVTPVTTIPGSGRTPKRCAMTSESAVDFPELFGPTNTVTPDPATSIVDPSTMRRDVTTTGFTTIST